MLSSDKFGVHLPTLVSVPIVVAVAALAGLMLGLPSRRLLGDYRFDVTSGRWTHREGVVEPPLRLHDVKYDGQGMHAPTSRLTGGEELLGVGSPAVSAQFGGLPQVEVEDSVVRACPPRGPPVGRRPAGHGRRRGAEGSEGPSASKSFSVDRPGSWTGSVTV